MAYRRNTRKTRLSLNEKDDPPERDDLIPRLRALHLAKPYEIPVDRRHRRNERSRPEIIPGAEMAMPGAEMMIPGADIMIPGAEMMIPGAEMMIPRPEMMIPGAEMMIPRPEMMIPGAEMMIPRPELMIPRLEIMNPRLEVMNPQPMRSEVTPKEIKMETGNAVCNYTVPPIPLTAFIPDNLDFASFRNNQGLFAATRFTSTNQEEISASGLNDNQGLQGATGSTRQGEYEFPSVSNNEGYNIMEISSFKQVEKDMIPLNYTVEMPDDIGFTNFKPDVPGFSGVQQNVGLDNTTGFATFKQQEAGMMSAMNSKDGLLHGIDLKPEETDPLSLNAEMLNEPGCSNQENATDMSSFNTDDDNSNNSDFSGLKYEVNNMSDLNNNLQLYLTMGFTQFKRKCKLV